MFELLLRVLQVIKEEDDRIFVHYTNYSSEFDCWVDRKKVIKKIPYQLPFTADYLTEKLKLDIKEKLVYRTHQSSEVEIKIDCTPELFCKLFSCSPNASLHPTNRELEDILGINWDKRITTAFGEKSTVIDGNVYITLT